MSRAWLALSLVACASAPPFVAKPVPVVVEQPPDAVTILARMETAYANAATYQDRGVVLQTYADGSDDRNSFSTAFVRDRYVSFEWTGTANKRADNVWFRVLSDYVHTYSGGTSRNAIDDGVLVGAALDRVSAHASGALGQLMPAVVPNGLVARLTAPRSPALDRVNGVDCWLIEGTDRDGHLLSIWLDRSTYLIKKWSDSTAESVTTVELESLAGAPVEVGNVGWADIGASPPQIPLPHAPRPDLGFRFDIKDEATVTSVESGSAAERAGIRVGDVVVKANKEKVERGVYLYMRVRKEPAGTKYDLTLSRAGKEYAVGLVSEIDPREQLMFDVENHAGTAIPALDLSVVAGTGSAKLDELKGKLVLIEIWSPSCPPCISGLSDLKQLKVQFPELEVIAVSNSPADVIRAQADALGTPFTFASDPNGTLAKHLNAHLRPLTILIDRTGIIRYIEVGKQTPSSLSKYVSVLTP